MIVLRIWQSTCLFYHPVVTEVPKIENYNSLLLNPIYHYVYILVISIILLLEELHLGLVLVVVHCSTTGFGILSTLTLMYIKYKQCFILAILFVVQFILTINSTSLINPQLLAQPKPDCKNLIISIYPC